MTYLLIIHNFFYQVKFPSLRGAAQQPVRATEHPEEALRRVP